MLLFSGVSCSKEQQNGLSASFPPLKYKIDGNFEDWKTYETIKTDTGIDWSKAVVTGYDGIHFTEFYEDSDSNYLYLFFKFKPSIQEKYEKKHSSGALGYLYIDTDANTNTGCTYFDTAGIPQSDTFRAGTSTISGSEIQIYFPIGFYINTETDGCYISFEIKRWNTITNTFSQTVRIADSRDSNALIAHGKDGVEAALLLSDLQPIKGNKITLAFWGDLVTREFVKRTTIQLR